MSNVLLSGQTVVQQVLNTKFILKPLTDILVRVKKLTNKASFWFAVHYPCLGPPLSGTYSQHNAHIFNCPGSLLELIYIPVGAKLVLTHDIVLYNHILCTQTTYGATPFKPVTKTTTSVAHFPILVYYYAQQSY